MYICTITLVHVILIFWKYIINNLKFQSKIKILNLIFKILSFFMIFLLKYILNHVSHHKSPDFSSKETLAAIIFCFFFFLQVLLKILLVYRSFWKEWYFCKHIKMLVTGRNFDYFPIITVVFEVELFYRFSFGHL